MPETGEFRERQRDRQYLLPPRESGQGNAEKCPSGWLSPKPDVLQAHERVWTWRAGAGGRGAGYNGSGPHRPLGTGDTRDEFSYLAQGRHFSKADDTLEKKPTGQGSQTVSETCVAGGEKEALTITVDQQPGSPENPRTGRPGRSSCCEPSSPGTQPPPTAPAPGKGSPTALDPPEADTRAGGSMRKVRFLLPLGDIRTDVCRPGSASPPPLGLEGITSQGRPRPNPLPSALGSSLRPLELVPRQATHRSA